MVSDTAWKTDVLVQFSRRGLWLALVMIIVLGAYAVALNLAPESQAAAVGSKLFALAPIGIVIAVAALRSGLRGVRRDAMKAILNDELRQKSLNLAYRNALIAVLLAQPVLVLLLEMAPGGPSLALMGGATAFTGVVVVLCSLLALDR